MRFVCDSCRAQYMISDEKVGAKGVKVRCKKCGYVILVRRPQDVAAAAPAPAAPPPAPPDDGVDATQVMMNPLAGMPQGGASDPDITAPGLNTIPPAAGKSGVLAGIADDEIGAVFDQVLQSGTHKIPADGAKNGVNGASAGEALGDSPDDRMSTRVLDLETVKKLADEAAAGDGAPVNGNGAHLNGKNGAAAAAEVPKQDWFVAIDEKQVGPLTLDSMKERWEQGEIGPDSLCWRAGFSDWLPLSEVSDLASVLAPQPKKPVIVASPVEPPVGAVVTVPVESAFTSGGVTRTVRSEVPVMTAAPAAGEDVGWKPSAASALASLVKEEIEALAKPQVQAKKVPEPAAATKPAAEEMPQVRGILDLPSAEHPIPTDAVVSKPAEQIPVLRSSAPAQGPSLASQPYGPTPYATSVYKTPQKSNNKALIAIGAAVLVLLLLLTGVVAWLALRDTSGGTKTDTTVAQQPAMPPTAVAQNTPAPPPPAAKAEEPAKAAAPAAPAAETKPAAAETKPEPAKAEVARRDEPAKTAEPEHRRTTTRERTERTEAVAPRETPKKVEAPAADVPAPGGDDDEFNAMFGGGDKPKAKKVAEAAPKKQSSDVYIPPAPGSATIPEKLGSSDIMQVVLQNKPAIVKCVNEQKAKDPGASGRLVMRWTIQTSGRTSNVSVQSAEFKSTYVATCIGGLIKSWRFPQHKVQGEPVDFPFSF